MNPAIEVPDFSGVSDLAVKILMVIGLVILLWIIVRFANLIINRMGRIPPDAKNGLKLITRILSLFVLFSVSAFIFEVNSEIILGSSAFFATAIGFASTTVAANLVGGLYIMITRPFGVGDFIKVKNESGVVLEIGLNYTSLLRMDCTIVTIPNSALLSTTLLNSNIPISDETVQKNNGRQVKIRKVSLTVPDVVIESIGGEIVRYSTMVQLKLNQYDPPLPLQEVAARLATVCENFESFFGFKPRFYFGEHIFRQNTHIVITAKDTDTLIENYPHFMEAIMESIFEELQGGEN